VEHARVALYRATRAGEALPQFGKCRGAGKFTIRGVPPGTYVARASHPDWVAGRRTVTVFARSETRVDLTLARLGGVVRVTVRDEEGRPLAGARVTLHREDGPEVRPARKRYDALYRTRKGQDPGLTWAAFYRSFTESGPNGAMTRQFLAPGTYRVKAVKRGFLPAETEVRVGGPAIVAATLTLRPVPPAPPGGSR
jgi:hypothetical protein